MSSAGRALGGIGAQAVHDGMFGAGPGVGAGEAAVANSNKPWLARRFRALETSSCRSSMPMQRSERARSPLARPMIAQALRGVIGPPRLEAARSVAISTYVFLGELITKTDMQPVEEYGPALSDDE